MRQIYEYDSLLAGINVNQRRHMCFSGLNGSHHITAIYVNMSVTCILHTNAIYVNINFLVDSFQ